jgi:hypothetical protein
MGDIKLVLIANDGNKLVLDQPSLPRALTEAETRMTKNMRNFREVRITVRGEIRHRWRAYVHWKKAGPENARAHPWALGHE